MKDIQVYSNEGSCSFPRGDFSKFYKGFTTERPADLVITVARVLSLAVSTK